MFDDIWSKVVLTIVGLVVVAACGKISGFFSYIKNLIVKDKTTVIKDMQEHDSEVDEDIKQIHETLNNLKDQQDHLKDGLLSLSRTDMYNIMSKCIKKGYTNTYIFEIVEKEFHAYKALGGNGIMDRIYDEFTKLPRKDKKWIDMK